MNINIKIKPSSQSHGVVMNKIQLNQKQLQKKNMLYGNPIPQSDKPRNQIRSETEKKKKISQTNKLPPKSVEKKIRNVQDEQLKKIQKELNQNINSLNTNQASMGMIYTSNQILKQQNQILHSNQKALNELLQHKKKTEQTISKNPKSKNEEQERIKQQQILRQVTGGINKQLEEIKRVRDEIFKMAKQVTNSLNEMKNTGQKPTLPNNFLEMNKNLKSLAQTSQHNIDLLSPQKFDLINKIQNFNIEGYTHHMNQLKTQIAQIQKQSEQVEKQLKQRVAKLQKITVNPKFEQQLLQPYQKNIKNRLSAINLQQCRKRVYDRLGQFDYTKFQMEVNGIMSDVKNQINQVFLNIQKYKIDVPQLKLDKKEIQSLQVKLPSILEEYKNARGIVLKNKIKKQPEKQVQRDFSSQQGIRTGQSISPSKYPKGTLRPQTIQGLVSEPKDYSKNVKLKRVGQKQFNTVFNEKNIQKQRKNMSKQTQSVQKIKQPKKKTRQEQDFQKYLENRANQQLEQLYKQRRDKLLRLKNQIYDQVNDDEPLLKITVDRKNKFEIQKKDKQQIKKIVKEPKQLLQKQSTQDYNNHLNNIGNKLFESREKIEIKQIGKQILKQKIKNIFSNAPPRNLSVQQPIIQSSNQNPFSVGENPINNFAQGFLTVINNTFAEMNRGLITNIEKKVKQKQQKQNYEFQQRKIPIPKLEQIPKPPIFKINFQQRIKGNIGEPIAQNFYQFPRPMKNNQNQQLTGFPTFSNNFYNQQPFYPKKIEKNDYKHLDIQPSIDNISYQHSEIQITKSDIESNLSKSDNISGISRRRSENR